MVGNNNNLNPKPSFWPNNSNHPVEMVSWNDTQIFFERLNAAESLAGRLPEGWMYALPTEAEWEYACRAGTTTRYSWGNNFNSSYANVDLENKWDYDPGLPDYVHSLLPATREVGHYEPNQWGFYDMHGNVWEWVQNWQETWRDPIGDPVTDPLGPTSGTHRAKRGGSWLNHPYNARSAERRFYYPNEKTHYFGFRVAFKKAEPAQPTTHTVDLNSSVNLEMIWVEPGTFTMGSPVTEEGRRSDETEHNVTITEGFYLGMYEVTQAQYVAVMTGNSEGLSTTPSHFSNNPNRPVERVSWDDAQVFLARLNEQQAGNLPAGWSYVLPTEAQWEYACRAGTTTAYSWGNSITSSDANYEQNIGHTTDVGQYAANPWGFFDMHGNVFEWTADWYQEAYPAGNPVIDPTGPASGSSRVHRGGTWGLVGQDLRSAERHRYGPMNRHNSIGFRVSFQRSQ